MPAETGDLESRVPGEEGVTTRSAADPREMEKSPLSRSFVKKFPAEGG